MSTSDTSSSNQRHQLEFFLEDSRRLDSLGKFDEALLAAKSAVALAPRHANAHAQLAHVLSHMKELPAALVAIDRAIELSGGNIPWVHIGKSHYLEQSGDLKAAVAAAKLAEKVAPDHAHTKAQLAHLEARKKDYGAALAYIDQAIALDGKNASFPWRKSAILDSAGQLEEAVEAARLAVTLAPDHKGIKSSLAKLIEKQRTQPAWKRIKATAKRLVRGPKKRR